MVLNLGIAQRPSRNCMQHFDLKHPSQRFTNSACDEDISSTSAIDASLTRTQSESGCTCTTFVSTCPSCVFAGYGLERFREGPCITCQGVETLKGSSTTHLRNKVSCGPWRSPVRVVRSKEQATGTFKAASSWDCDSLIPLSHLHATLSPAPQTLSQHDFKQTQPRPPLCPVRSDLWNSSWNLWTWLVW